MGLTGFDSG